MKFSFFRTIRSHLLLLVLISVLPALGIIIYSGVDRSFRDIEEAKSDALQVVKNFSFDHERTVESTRQFLMTLAKIPEIQNLNVPASNRLLSELLKQNPQYGTLFVVNAQGILYSSGTPLPPTPLSCKTRKYFRDAVRKKDFSVGEYGICPVVKHPVIEFSYPITAAKDQFKGVVVVSLDLARFAQMLPMEKIPQGSTLSFGDHKGNLLYHYPNIKENVPKVDLPDMIKNMSAQPDEGVFTYTGVKGIKRLYTYKKFRMKAKEPPYLFMRVGILEEKALFRARRAMSVNLVFLGVAFIIAVFSACFLGNAIIVGRLNKLVDASRRLGHGDLKTRTGLPYKRDELGELTKVFDEMAEALETKNAEHEQAEERIKKVADEWQTTFDSITDLVMILDKKGRVVRMNDKAAHFFDLPMDRILGDYCFPLFHETGKPPESSLFHKMIETKQHEEADLYFSRSGIWLFVSADPIQDPTGNVIGGVYIVKDISDRKRSEEALKESENKFRDLAEKSSVGIYIVQDGIFKYVNEKVAEHGSYSVEELIDKMGPKDVVLPEDWPIVEENVRKRLSHKGESLQYEFRERTKDNKIIHVEVRGSRTMYQGRPAIIGTSIDITNRKRAEEALRESEKKFRDLAEKSLVGVYIIQDGVFKYANAKVAEQIGYSVEELIDKMGPKDFLLPEDWPIAEENVQKRLSGEVESLQYEFREHTKDNKIIHVEVHGSRTMYQGRPALIGTSIDITDRKRAEEALRESEEKFRDLAEKSLVGIYIVQDGVFKYANTKIAEQRGYSVEELIDKMGPKDFLLPEDRPIVEENIRKRLSGEVESLQYEFREHTKDNKIIHVEVRGSRTMYQGRPAVIGTSIDITDRKRAEEKLRESEEIFRQLAENIREVFYIYEQDMHELSYISPAYVEIWGRPCQGLYQEPKSLWDAVHPEDKDRVRGSLEKKSHEEVEEVYRIVRPDGSIRWIKERSFPIHDDSGKTRRVVGIATDITDLKLGEEKLKFLSLHDSLTGLYNRIYFEEEMSRIERARYDMVGIVSCDVDGLKLVNDTLGHNQGDNLLVAAARVIRDSFREGDLVARIGGDEFSVVLPNTTEAAVENACQRIQEAVAGYNASNPELPLSISVGFAVSNGVYRNAKELFKEADNSMYRKKLYRTQSVRSTIVKTLINTLKARDLTTEQHVIRLERLLAHLAAFIGLPESTTSDLSLLARFHDIGKVGISDTILFKGSSLTSVEWSEMKRHCEIGYRMALSAPELVPIADWILKHHEWWNGQGYPLGIKGEEIPIECRLLSITEAYEAMTSVRPYRRAFSHREAVAELLKHSGTQFDPKLVERFIQMLETHPPELGTTPPPTI